MHDPCEHLDSAFNAQFGDRDQSTERESGPAPRCDRTRDMFDDSQQDSSRAA